jgi:hypothetical protein
VAPVKSGFDQVRGTGQIELGENPVFRELRDSGTAVCEVRPLAMVDLVDMGFGMGTSRTTDGDV